MTNKPQPDYGKIALVIVSGIIVVGLILLTLTGLASLYCFDHC